jgi:protein-disulfide isomerase
MANNADQKNQARIKREEVQAQAEAVAKRNKMLQILAGVVFAAVVVVIAVVIIKSSTTDKTAADGSDVQGVATTNALLKGIPQNGLTIGDKDAPITIIEFIDVQCPFCKANQIDHQPTVIKELVKTGKAQLRLAPVALPMMGEDSEAGRTVAVRLAEQNKGWAFLNLFYLNQGDERTGYVTETYLKSLIKAAGGDPSTQASRTPTEAEAAKLKEIDDLSAKLNVTGTPSFAIGKTGADPSTYKLVQVQDAQELIDAVNTAAAANKGT